MSGENATQSSVGWQFPPLICSPLQLLPSSVFEISSHSSKKHKKEKATGCRRIRNGASRAKMNWSHGRTWKAKKCQSQFKAIKTKQTPRQRNFSLRHIDRVKNQNKLQLFFTFTASCWGLTLVQMRSFVKVQTVFSVKVDFLCTFIMWPLEDINFRNIAFCFTSKT